MDFECAYCGESTYPEPESIDAEHEFRYDCRHCGKTNVVTMVCYLTAMENDDEQ